MATKIKRCLFIGLGGTGMKSLLHTKKMFIDTYGEVPPMIGFLGIDTDGGEYTKSLYSALGEKIILNPNEQLPIHVEDAKPIYNRQRASLSWIPDQNVYALSSMTLGAGQVRTNGRFALTVNKNRVVTAIKNKLNEIQRADIINNKNYELLSTGAPEIHMVFSICGGTGSGTFLNMAYLLRDVAHGSKINGYAVLPDVFKSMTSAGMAKVTPNAYGALYDLDYLMHRSMNDTPLFLEYLNDEQYEITERPFNSVVFIDNKNKNGDTYTNVNQLTEMISLALVTASGELSVAGAAVGDNLEKNITEGAMNIENKIAWAGGMGACELVYRGDALAKIYQIKAAQNIIARLFNSCDDANIIANAWIDSSAVHIRENNNQDHVTDYVSPKEPRFALTINDFENPIPEVKSNIDANKLDDKEATAKVDELLTRARTELRKLIVKHMNAECGITLAEKIIESIKIEMGLCLDEMRQEKANLAKELPQKKTEMDAAIADLKEYASGFFATRKNKEMRASIVSTAVAEIVKTVTDIKRHDAAITFYQSFLVILNDTEEKIKQVASMFRTIESSLAKRVSVLQKSVGDDDAIFQINLATEDARMVSVNSNDILISEFVKAIDGDLKLYGMGEYSAKEVEKIILDYTATLPGVKAYENKNIEDVLQQIAACDEENGTNELRSLLDRAVKKSMPLFRHDPEGYSRTEDPCDIFYVGVFNSKDSILVKDDLFKSCIAGMPDVQFASTGMRDKIIIYRQVGVVPAFTIDGIKNFKRCYEESRACDFHFDANIKLRMERDGFDLWPTGDDEEGIFGLWVKGFVYGLIKNENKCYYMKCSLGDILNDNWYKLAEWRDEAFQIFMNHEGVVTKEFSAHINKECERAGADATRQLLDKVKEEYYDNFSQIKITKDTLKAKGYEKVRELMRKELEYVQKL